MELVLQQAALAAYGAAALLAFAALLPRLRLPVALPPVCAAVGFLSQLGALLERGRSVGGLPPASLDVILTLATLAAVLAYLYGIWRHRLHAVGVIILPLALLLTLSATLLSTTAVPVSERLRDPLLKLHITISAIGVGALFLTFAVSILYLVQERRLKGKRPVRPQLPLPSLNTCDRVLYLSLLVGFALLTAGLATGVVWSQSFRGTFFAWRNRREALALISWVIFAVVLYARLVRGWRGRKSALAVLTGFTAILLRLFWVTPP